MLKCHGMASDNHDLMGSPAQQTLIDALYREEVLTARAMSPEEKFLAGEELFNYACAITLAGIRNQHPGLSEEEHRRILRERIALGDKLKMGP